MCIQPKKRGSVVCLSIRKMNNKKVQLVNTEGAAKVTSAILLPLLEIAD